MKVLVVPLIVMGAVAGELTVEPNEAQMRGAFEQTLAKQVRSVVDFVAESSGSQAADAIRTNGTHRFEVRAFQKHACVRVTGQQAYRCEFSVDIDVINGSLHRALTGRFFNGPQGLTFAQEESEASLPAVASAL